jgi:hypothetical protein
MRDFAQSEAELPKDLYLGIAEEISPSASRFADTQRVIISQLFWSHQGVVALLIRGWHRNPERNPSEVGRHRYCKVSLYWVCAKQWQSMHLCLHNILRFRQNAETVGESVNCRDR